jgi:hypothetical protein
MKLNQKWVQGSNCPMNVSKIHARKRSWVETWDARHRTQNTDRKQRKPSEASVAGQRIKIAI